jgi:hypothetical protein
MSVIVRLDRTIQRSLDAPIKSEHDENKIGEMFWQMKKVF